MTFSLQECTNGNFLLLTLPIYFFPVYCTKRSSQKLTSFSAGTDFRSQNLETGTEEPPEDGEMNEMTLPTEFEIQALAVLGRARYLSVTGATHNIQSSRVSGDETIWNLNARVGFEPAIFNFPSRQL